MPSFSLLFLKYDLKLHVLICIFESPVIFRDNCILSMLHEHPRNILPAETDDNTILHDVSEASFMK